MDTDAIRDFLRVLTAAFTEAGMQTELEETPVGAVLYCAVPGAEGTENRYQISVSAMQDRFGVIEVEMTLLEGIAEESIPQFERLVTGMNPFLQFGSLLLYDGALLYTQSMVFDAGQDAAAVTALLGKMIGIMETTCEDLSQPLSRFLQGESPESVLDGLRREAAE